MHSTISLPGFEDAIILKTEVREGQYLIHFEMPITTQVCPNCRKDTRCVHDYRWTKVKHLTMAERMTTLFYRKRCYACACGKCFTEKKIQNNRHCNRVRMENCIPTPTIEKEPIYVNKKYRNNKNVTVSFLLQAVAFFTYKHIQLLYCNNYYFTRASIRSNDSFASAVVFASTVI